MCPYVTIRHNHSSDKPYQAPISSLANLHLGDLSLVYFQASSSIMNARWVPLDKHLRSISAWFELTNILDALSEIFALYQVLWAFDVGVVTMMLALTIAMHFSGVDPDSS